MNNIKMLDLYLFEGVPEKPTRHYADDTHAFETGRGTREGISSGMESDLSIPLPEENSYEFGSIQYDFDTEQQAMTLVIK